MIAARKFIVALSAISSLAVATPACAVPKPAPRIPTWKQSHFAEGDVATRATYIVAVCVRDKRLAQAETMLRAAPGSPEERAAVPLAKPPAVDECLFRKTGLRIRGLNILRGAIAEAIYNGRAARPRSNQSLPFDLQSKVPINSTAPADAASPRMVAACAAQQFPGRAHKMLQFNPGSIGERRALQALSPTFESCLPLNARLTATPLAMRAAIAEALYFAWRSQSELFESK